jgi:hypothetical protein
MLKELLLVLALAATSSSEKPDQPDNHMQVSPLTSEDLQGLSSDRDWVNSLLAGFGSTAKLTQSREDVPTLHSLLDGGPYTADASAELAVFGTVYGDVLAKEIGLHWVVVTDNIGSDYALQFQDKQVFVFPRSMLLKRVERGEQLSDINLDAMLAEIRVVVQEQAAVAATAEP